MDTSLTMKFISFNINGLRARPHQLAAIVEKYQPDVIGLQETKVHDDMFPLDDVKQLGYHIYYHGQKGHYGVALLLKNPPLAIRKGFATDDEDAQRRIIMADIATENGPLTVINGYFLKVKAAIIQLNSRLKKSFIAIYKPMSKRLIPPDSC